MPLVERVHRLHVVMPVDERRGQVGIDDALGIYGRVALRLDELGAKEAGRPGRLGEILGIAPDVCGVAGIGGDAGDSEELDELFNVVLLMGGAIGVEVVLRHPRSLVGRPLGLHPL